MDKVLALMGLARKAGYLKAGERITGSVVRAGKARAIFVAADASENAKKRAYGFAAKSGAALVGLPHTKEQISCAFGGNGYSMSAITDIGFASRIVRELSGDYPEKYVGIAELLKCKEAKESLREQKATAHLKNAKTGKRRSDNE